jgi:hypothetical protein
VSERDPSEDGFTGGLSGSPEEAAWRDLISRYETPSDRSSGPAPWPDREDLPDTGQPAPGADSTGPDDDGTGDDGNLPATEDTDGTDGAQTADQPTGQSAWFNRARVIRPATSAPPGASQRSPRTSRSPGEAAGHNAPGGPGYANLASEADDAEDHYIPPPPPPLPHLDPVAKGAWLALFGGPAYLLISTLIGMNAPGWAAFLAVAAFIGGFAVVVLRLGDKPSRGDGPDNGAVV